MIKKKLIVIIALILLTVVLLLVYNNYYDGFNKEGELIFLMEKGKKEKQISIEIAETKQERNQGLMNRKKLDKNNGMLFIYNTSYKRFFWMKNTYIPLDIIYVDNTYHVVSIQENTEPLLEKKYPSYKKAMYVVEVNAGFCNMHNIKVGDSISYKRI